MKNAAKNYKLMLSALALVLCAGGAARAENPGEHGPKYPETKTQNVYSMDTVRVLSVYISGFKDIKLWGNGKFYNVESPRGITAQTLRDARINDVLVLDFGQGDRTPVCRVKERRQSNGMVQERVRKVYEIRNLSQKQK